MFDVLGVLFKRCTLLLPTKDRLKFIFSKLSQVRKGQVRCQAITEYCNFLNELHLFLIFLSEGNDTSVFCNVLQKLKKKLNFDCIAVLCSITWWHFNRLINTNYMLDVRQ